jgi:hypothetical protein
MKSKEGTRITNDRHESWTDNVSSPRPTLPRASATNTPKVTTNSANTPKISTNSADTRHMAFVATSQMADERELLALAGDGKWRGTGIPCGIGFARVLLHGKKGV